MTNKGKNMGNLIQALSDPGQCAEAAKRFPTGIPQLDEKMHGGLSIGLIGVPAGPSEGKTTMGLQISSNLSAKGFEGFYFSSEMTAQKMAAVSVSRQSFINNPDAALTSEEVIELCDRGEMTPELTSAIEKASDNCKNIILYGCNDWEHTVQEIVDEVTKYKASHTDEDVFVVLDYLQELHPSEEEKKLERKDFIDHAIITLKELSEELQIPILVICAINRDNGYVGETSMSQIKDSGRLEYNYDMIIALERKRTISEREREVYLHILKQKDGEMGCKILCKYHAAYNYFEDAVHKKMEREISPHTAELYDILDELTEWDMDPDE